MNKYKTIIATLILVITVGGLLLTNNKDNKFKIEYESLNGKKNSEGKTYKKLTIDEDNPFEYATYDDIFNVLDNTGIIYFGFPECPWCRNALPVLLEAAEDAGIEKIYYMNNKEDRDEKKLKKGKVITEKKATKNYEKLLKKIGDKASIYEGLEDENIKRLYFPTVLVVKNGEIVETIVGTVSSQTDPYTNLTKNQKEELKRKYIDAMTQTLVCTSVAEKC